MRASLVSHLDVLTNSAHAFHFSTPLLVSLSLDDKLLAKVSAYDTSKLHYALFKSIINVVSFLHLKKTFVFLSIVFHGQYSQRKDNEIDNVSRQWLQQFSLSL